MCMRFGNNQGNRGTRTGRERSPGTVGPGPMTRSELEEALLDHGAPRCGAGGNPPSQPCPAAGERQGKGWKIPGCLRTKW